MGIPEPEACVQAAFEWICGPTTPPQLHAAMRHAVFSGAGRVRPRMVLATAAACRRGVREVGEAAAAAVELLHCASLVHDDLPCFDDAPTRRGKPSVHVRFGQPIAVLTGDALISGAFEVLARGCASYPEFLPPLVSVFGAGVGAVRGLVAGQAWESEREADLREYHRAKTGALFEAAVQAGAIAGGGDPAQWTPVGTHLGEAYQVADDILDLVGDADQLGKPVRQDSRNNRPSAALEMGLDSAYERLRALQDAMFTCVPAVEGREAFVQGLMCMCMRVFPRAQRVDPQVWSEPAVASM